MKFCSNCGSENQDGSAFCYKCGMKLAIKSVPEVIGTQDRQDNKNAAAAQTDNGQQNYYGQYQNSYSQQNGFSQQNGYSQQNSYSQQNEYSQQYSQADMNMNGYGGWNGTSGQYAQQTDYNYSSAYENRSAFNSDMGTYKLENYINPAKFDPKYDYTPISSWGYVGYYFLFFIPIAGFILAIVFACGGTNKINLKNMAKGFLWLLILLIAISIIMTIVGVSSMFYFASLL